MSVVPEIERTDAVPSMIRLGDHVGAIGSSPLVPWAAAPGALLPPGTVVGRAALRDDEACASPGVAP